MTPTMGTTSVPVASVASISWVRLTTSAYVDDTGSTVPPPEGSDR